MAREGVLHQEGEGLVITPRGDILKRADAQVAGCHASEHGPGQDGLPDNRFTRGHHRQRARRRNAQGMHRLAEKIFAEHGAEGGPPIAAA